jgi:predicted ATPase
MAPIIAFRMVEISIEYGVCNITPFAFGVYGAFLVSAAALDNEGGYRMGRVATELMKRLNAVEIVPRLYTTIYAMINIWKEPFQASLSKHLEAFDIGAHRGDVSIISFLPQPCTIVVSHAFRLPLYFSRWSLLSQIFSNM